MFHFYVSGKCQKIFGFFIFSQDMEIEHWTKVG